MRKEAISVILTFLCTICWTINVMMRFAFMRYSDMPGMLAMDLIFVVCWIIVLVVAVKRYRSSKE